MNDISASLQEKQCKICYESEPKELISPCLCTGSSEFVHEQCLKTWISSRDSTLSNPRCEICQYEYKMSLKHSKVFNPSKGIEEEFLYCCLIPVFLIIIILLSIIIVILAFFTLNFRDNPAYSWCIIGICLFPLVISLVFLWAAVKKILYTVELQEWKIFSIERSLEMIRYVSP